MTAKEVATHIIAGLSQVQEAGPAAEASEIEAEANSCVSPAFCGGIEG